MKKKVILIMSLCLMLTGVAVASSINGDYKGNPIVKIRVSGAEIHPEVPGNIVDGNTMLPLRAISESLGANVQWHPEDYSVDIKMPKKLSLTELNKIGESVGVVYVYDQQGQYQGQGSGILLENGIFITCDHVGSVGTSLKIELNGKTYTTDKYLFKNSATDIYAVKIDATGGLKYTTTLPAAGQGVFSLGFPHNKFQINEGMYAYPNSDQNIVHTAKTDSGSSGGALIDNTGLVVGVTSAKADNTDYNVAIPMAAVKQEIDKLK